MRSRKPRSPTDIAAAIALLACGVVAVANLPLTQLPLGWLLAWTAPAAFFGCLRRRPRRPWLRALAAGATQIAAFALALRYAGTLSRPAILACTILPPLAFVTARRRDSDASLGLFLSFCVLLVGVILGGSNLPMLAGYGLAACLSLRCETWLAACAQSSGPRQQSPAASRARPILLTGLAVALPCLFVAFAVERTLAWLPSPLRDHGEQHAAANQPQVFQKGLDDTFRLGSGGILADLAGEELVLVHGADGAPVPPDLYLRCGFFAEPDLHEWRVGRLDLAPPTTSTAHTIGERQQGPEERWLAIDRFAGARNFVFVPPHAIELRGLTGLNIDRTRLWLRQAEDSTPTSYTVSYQPMTGARMLDAPDGDGQRLGLLELPPSLDRARYLALLDEWGADGTPERIARRIAVGLAERCRYDRIEPVGPYRHTIDNFLFAEGDRRGFCMHFATAAALMLRLRGVPCRIGVGLYGGGPDRNDPAARIYGSQHAHAWVEIRFENRGFVVFDPTPPEERGQRMPSRPAPAIEDDAPAAGAGAAVGFWRGLLDFVLQPWFLLGVLVLAGAASLWPNRQPGAPEIVMPRSVRSARRLLVRILRALGARGHLRQRGETLEQFSAVLHARDRLAPAVAAAFRSYQEIRFGGFPLDDERERTLLSGIESALATEPAVAAAAEGITAPRTPATRTRG
ncbi:MAG: DUF4129 domain-containing protein [Planctomycetes bacterium]|nr:DUF4129 domain-containing protein [Planctomycetota bacterium]